MNEAITEYPSSGLTIVNATDWVQSFLLGTVGTSIAVLAMAGVGLAMLQGRMPSRRGALIVIGCFTIFSARTIAELFLYAAPASSSEAVILSVAPPAYIASVPPPVAYDPYAGASVPVRQGSNQTMLPQ